MIVCAVQRHSGCGLSGPLITVSLLSKTGSLHSELAPRTVV